ncbi:MAG: VanZ family protein, partial [Gammaproteobacteria bacterium]
MRRIIGVVALVYAMIVIYGSLIPFNYQPLGLDHALRKFGDIRYLNLGTAARADWIANILLYIPLGGLLFGSLFELRRTSGALAGVLALACGGVFAIGIEFVQLQFPPRTVSLNDLIAEGLGLLLGVLLARFGTARFVAVLSGFKHAPHQLPRLALYTYIALYLALVLFPFDLLVSKAELLAKLASPAWGWLIAEQTRNLGMINFAIKCAAEIALVAPFGWLLAKSRRFEIGLARGVGAGFVLGLVVEICQFFLASGISQGLSVITRGIGVGLGMTLTRLSFAPQKVLMGRTWRWLSRPLYLLYLLQLGGYFSSSYVGLPAALAKLDTVHWTPFYYHYFTTEVAATISLLVVALSFGVIGIVIAVQSVFAASSLRPLLASTLVAFALSATLEFGKLFLAEGHPDPTSILIACCAAWLACKLTWHLQHAPQTSRTVRTERDAPPTVRDRSRAKPVKAARTTSWPKRAVQSLFIALSLVLASRFPLAAGWLMAALALYGVIMLNRPTVWMLVLPALLPILDLAHWSGAFFLDEFDLFVLMTLGSAYFLQRPATANGPSPLFNFGMRLTLLSYAVSLAIPLWPLPTIDLNSFNNYYSPYAGLRAVKGVLSGFVLLHLFRIDPRPYAEKFNRLAIGIAIGLSLATAFILWERAAFPGLFNFNADYRVTGAFSAMHTGGAYIETYLVAAIPFLCFVVLTTSNVWFRLGAFGLLGAATYGLVVTYSRGGYAAFAVAAVVLTLGYLKASARTSDRLRRAIMIT